MRDNLSDIAAFLGFANCELFPIQIEIRADRGDTGNFLNLPYFGADDTDRYAINNEGKAYSLIEFFSSAIAEIETSAVSIFLLIFSSLGALSASTRFSISLALDSMFL